MLSSSLFFDLLDSNLETALAFGTHTFKALKMRTRMKLGVSLRVLAS
jgi:hypothetical protein